MHPSLRRVVIVGAGYSGTAVAIELLRLAKQPLHIVLIDRSGVARGVAYARRNYPFLLNVPAGRMSTNSAHPNEFLNFVRKQSPQLSAEDFIERERYGDYLDAMLRAAELSAAPQATLERVCGNVIALERFPRNAGVRMYLENGRCLYGDSVVLALGNSPPAQLSVASEVCTSARYIDDPWKAPLRFRSNETTLILGTGLTMADVVLAARQQTGGDIKIHALSRHGLTPLPQAPLDATREQRDAMALVAAAGISLPHLVRAIRLLAEKYEQRGGTWRDAVAVVREQIPAIWRQFSMRERRRFLRHVRSYWEVHRHRLPGQTWDTLSAMRQAGSLQIHSGRVIRLKSTGKQIEVLCRARGSGETYQLRVDRVINCTGPNYDVRQSTQPLLRSLVAQGMAVSDPLGLGLVTDPFGALMDASGVMASNLHYIGPMLRPIYWEISAVEELREQARRLALELSARLCGRQMASAPEARMDRRSSLDAQGVVGVQA
jgi:uncharacterized NAD(P)/FAD-binding protein YdhS